MGRRFRLRLVVAALAVAAGVALPGAAAAHPLGNFTINHYAGLSIAPDGVDLDVVIDMAEIPAFQERQAMDGDGDGSVADAEGTSWAAGACAALRTSLDLRLDGAALSLTDVSSSVSFPPGAGGLSTLRLECAYRAPFATRIVAPAVLTFSDRSYAERIGWREILAGGAGTIVDTHGLPTTSPSRGLTSYPADLLKSPLDVRSASIDVRPDPSSPAATPSAPATPAPGSVGGPASGGSPPAGEVPGGVVPGGVVPGGVVPGGVAGEVPDVFRTADLTPFVILVSLLTAVAIGAGHALTPGHGKTLMAAYLVGSRGTAVHAVGLGLSVAVSHTLGIVALALIIVGAGSVLPPDVVYRVTPVVAGVSIVAIGGWMLVGEVRRRATPLARTAGAPAPEPGYHHPHDGHDGDDDAAAHSHGGLRHSHLQAAGSTLSWRGLFVLGLAGGLIPSTSALLILLGSIAAGRPAFGLLLVVAFGLGMAAVMTGVGLAMTFARGRLDRVRSRSGLGRVAAVAPLVASVAVLGLGIVLTWQAVAGSPVL
jgi:ABC-type nickel/cobalt efflux system permease component RcnA